MAKRIQILSVQVTEADARYAELKDELNVARDEILLQQDDKHFLQRSLDALADENRRLSDCLAESDAAGEGACLKIERMKQELNAALLARKDLTAALDEMRQKHQRDAENLRASRLERTKLVTALNRSQESHQTEVRQARALEAERNELATALDRIKKRRQTEAQKLKTVEGECAKLIAALAKITEKRRVEVSRLRSRLDDTNARADVAEGILAKLRQILLEKFNLLQMSIGTKDGVIYELEQSRVKLVDATKMLLGIFEMRDMALKRGDERIGFLTSRIAELEAQLHPSRNWHGLDRLIDEPLHRETAAGSDQAHKNEIWPDSNGGVDFTAIRERGELASSCRANAMLTATVTF